MWRPNAVVCKCLSWRPSNSTWGVLTLLMDAGVVDSGKALVCAARAGREVKAKHLLRQRFEWPLGPARNESAYLNTPCPVGTTALVYAIGFAGCCSPRVVRMLVDVGADASSVVRVLSGLAGDVFVDDTPLGLAELCLRRKDVGGREATEEQLIKLEAIRRLLTRAAAVHAVSWLWFKDAAAAAAAAAPALQVAKGKAKTATTTAAASASTTGSPLTTMLPLLRRRSRRGVLLAPLFRYVVMGAPRARAYVCGLRCGAHRTLGILRKASRCSRRDGFTSRVPSPPCTRMCFRVATV